MMVLNVISPRTQSSRWNGTAEQTFQGMRNYGNGKMAIIKSAMKQLRAYINFTQIRFHCGKKKRNNIPRQNDSEHKRCRSGAIFQR